MEEEDEDTSVEDLGIALESSRNDVLNIYAKVKGKIQKLREMEAHWKELESLMEVAAKSAKDKIKLDIGGKNFSVSKSNLLKHRGSYFFAMLSSGKFLPGDDGFYFIDRCPKFFDRILNYMRDGIFEYEGLLPFEIEKIKRDMTYYQLEMPVPLLKWDILKSNCLFSDDNLKCTKTTANGWNCAVISNIKVDKFTIKCNNSVSNNCSIGFISSPAIFNQNSFYHANSGFYSLLCNGQIFINGGHNSNTTGFGTNDYLTFIREGGSVRYEKNKVHVTNINFNLPNEPLHIVVAMHDTNASFSIVTDY